MIEQIQTDSPKILAFKLSGKLHDEDYQTFVPAVDAAVAAEGEIRLFVQFEADFQGWDLHAAWDDIKFAASHYANFNRIAMVGNRKWEEWMAKIGKPFTAASIGYFDASEVEVAWMWLREGV